MANSFTSFEAINRFSASFRSLHYSRKVNIEKMEKNALEKQKLLLTFVFLSDANPMIFKLVKARKLLMAYKTGNKWNFNDKYKSPLDSGT